LISGIDIGIDRAAQGTDTTTPYRKSWLRSLFLRTLAGDL